VTRVIHVVRMPRLLGMRHVLVVLHLRVVTGWADWLRRGLRSRLFVVVHFRVILLVLAQ
jgi:hypothetical protein